MDSASEHRRKPSRQVLSWGAPLVLGVAVAIAVRVFTADAVAPAPRATPAPWPLPDEAKARIAAADLPRYDERGAGHFHAHLDVFVDGVAVEVPGGIGLTPPYAAVHTHSTSGILHVETAEPSVPVTLGQFFTVWGVRLSAGCVGGYCAPATPPALFLNGSPVRGNPAEVVLGPGDVVAIVVGAAPATVPSTYDCATAASIEHESCLRSFVSSGQ